MRTHARTERRIGPVGTATRVAGGLAAIVVPVAVTGITWWDVGAAFVVLPAMAMLAAAAISAMERRRLRQSEVASSWVRSTLALALAIGVRTAVTFVTAVDGTAIWVFLGLSILIAAVRGDGACEVIALPNALAGRKDRSAA